MDTAQARETYINRHIRPIGPYVAIEIDLDGEQASASFLSIYESRAHYRDGYGCVLDHGQPPVKLDPRPLEESTPIDLNIDQQQLYFDTAALASALDRAFTEPSADAPRQTMAVVVLHQGHLVAEKYAPGISKNTPLPGFSMAKSMTGTMVGLLVQHKDLDVGDVVSSAGNLTRAGATYDHLLRMTSGIGIEETGSGRDSNSIMLTQRYDAFEYAIERPLHDSPGNVYAYNGGNFIVLAKKFIDIAGDGRPAKAYDFLYENLLRPMALDTVVLETDGNGTFLGSSFMLASALDWAKLGQLYLQDGMWDGKRLLPEGWVKYVSTKTKQSGARDYGASFWVAVSGGRDSRHPHLPQPPDDALFMHGMMNQVVYIFPRQKLVIVRLGATRRYLESGEWSLFRDVLASLKL